jgi:hypothetical protein
VLSLAIGVGHMEAEQPARVRVPISVLERYVGEYEGEGGTIKVVVSGDTLYQELPAQRRALEPISETLFYVGGVFTAEFVTEQAGGATMVMTDGIEVEHRLPRKGSRVIPPPSPAPVQVPRSVLEQYVGTYEFIPGQMSRTDLRVVVRLKGDKLVRVMMEERVLTPISQTQFRVGNTSMVTEFVVDEAGVTQVMGAGFQQLLSRRTSKR